ncbi:response regulator [Lusitaniella coriacea]|uniref:response regulator n=1 Tax=Lusitaniella coriacea TaxID=1983105 RepID=UPI003CEB2992
MIQVRLPPKLKHLWKRNLPLLAASCAIAGVLATVAIVDHAEQERFREQERADVLNQLSTHRAKLEAALNQRLFLTRGLLSHVSVVDPDITQPEFERLAQTIASESTGIRGFSLYKNSVVSHMYPLKGNESAIGFDPRTIPDERDAIARSIQNRKTIVAGPINLVPEGIAFIGRTPIFLTPPNRPPESGSYWGMVGIIIERDTLFKEAGLIDSSTPLQYALRGKDGLGEKGEIFFGKPQTFQQNPVTLNITLPNGSWQLAAVPLTGWSSVAPISRWIWLGGSVLALATGSLIFILVSAPTRLQSAVERATQELRESQTALERANQELTHLDQLKDEFLANTSHELRTPLNGIIGIAESLVDGATGQLPDITNTNLAMIASAGRRLSTLINDILDFSKLKHQTLELQIKPTEVRAIVDVVLALSRPLIGKKALQLLNSIHPETPLIDADENRLQQILYNLIGNAIKFTETGSVEVSAEIVDNPQNPTPFLAITIADTGIGIPEERFDRIFESFEQADGSTAREYGGTGLGLAVTQQLVQLHGGDIQLTSIVGEGSQFTFTLPISATQIQPLSTKHPIQSLAKAPELIQSSLIQPDSISTQSPEFKILIVDDEPINLQVLANLLSLENYSITQANNGIEALETIEQGFQPDLILLDVMMPRMTGYEVSEKLREKFLPSEIPIVMLTAKNQVSDLVEGFRVGANDYLAKPFNKNELFARIKTHLRLTKINTAYGRFVPQDFLRFLKRDSIVDVQLGDNLQTKMSVLFSDIRSFTELSERMTPQENFAFINSYLGRVSPVIREHNGFIDKYIGDAVMALFPQSPEEALNAAIAMQQQVRLYNQDRLKSGYAAISIGIGLHTGKVMLGTIGEVQRMESTVISDAVNLASRLEGLTKLYGSGIIISSETLCQLENFDRYKYRFLDRVVVKGKKQVVAIFEVYDGDTPVMQQLKSQTKTQFEEAIVWYSRQNFDRARQMFEAVLSANPQDRAAELYLQRCHQYQQEGVREDWNGVAVLLNK